MPPPPKVVTFPGRNYHTIMKSRVLHEQGRGPGKAGCKYFLRKTGTVLRKNPLRVPRIQGKPGLKRFFNSGKRILQLLAEAGLLKTMRVLDVSLDSEKLHVYAAKTSSQLGGLPRLVPSKPVYAAFDTYLWYPCWYIPLKITERHG